MKNIDFTFVECFGYTKPIAKCWTNLADEAFTGRDKTSLKELELSLKTNVESSYYRLVGAGIKDLDSDIEYFVSFVNGKKKWDIEIKDSKSAEVLPEERDEFFKSESFKKLLDRANTYIDKAKDIYTEKIKQHIEAGELMQVDETKAEAIESMLNDGMLLKNLKSGKYITQ